MNLVWRSKLLSRWSTGLIVGALCALLGVLPAAAQTAGTPLQRVQGNAADLAITPDGTVYVIDVDGKPWVQRLGRGANWSPLQGNFRAIRAGLDGSVWAIAKDDVAFRLSGNSWREMPFGRLRDLAAMPSLAADGPVVVLNAEGALEVRLPASNAGAPLYKVDDEAFKAAAFERLAVDEHGLPWVWRANGTMWRFDGTRWSDIPQFAATGLTSVAAGLDGTLMAVERGGRAYRWNPAAKEWMPEPLAAPVQLVAVGPNGKPWYAMQDHTLLASEVFANQNNQARAKPAALFTRLLSWRRVRGEASWLAVGADGTVVTIDAENTVWRWKGGNTWTPLTGKFRRAAVAGNGVVWGIDLQNRVRRNATGQWLDAGIDASEIAVGPKEEVWALGPSGNIGRFDAQTRQWQGVPGGPAKAIAVGKDGEGWIIDATGTVQLLNPATPIPGIVATSLAIGPEGTVYATTAERQLFWLDPRERQWKPATGVAAAVAVGPAGTPWIIGERNELQVSTAFTAEIEAIVAARTAQAAPPPPVFSIPAPGASTSPTSNRPLVYTTIAGAYTDVGIGPDGNVFAAGTDGGLYCFSNPDSRFVLASSGSARRVAVAGGGVPWVVNSLGQVSFFGGTGWTIVPNFRADDIAVGQDGRVYATQQNVVYRYEAVTQDFREITTYTSGVPLRARRVAFAQNALWGVNASNQLLKCDGTQCQPQSIGAIDVSSGPDGSVMVLDANGAVQRYNPRTRGFDAANGTGSSLSVGPQGRPWLVTGAGSINSSGLFATTSKTINQANCAQRFAGATIPAVAQTTTQLTAVDDTLTVRQGATVSLIANDRLNGSAPATSSVTVTFTTSSTQLTHSNGGITVNANATVGTTLSGTYTVCALPGAAPCSSARVQFTVAAAASATADTATVNPGATFNLLANDSLNGAVPTSAQVTVTFTSTSARLSQTGGLLTLQAGTPAGSVHTATYRFCATAGTPCSGTVNVSITAAGGSATATADTATINSGATFNLLANDLLNGATPTSGQVTMTFNSASASLTQVGGLLTLNAAAVPASVHTATYSFCATAGTPCSGTVNVSITATPNATAVADTATLNAGDTFNLLANDLLNGATPTGGQVTVTFNTVGQFLTQANGVLTVDPQTPTGQYTATYSFCATAGTPCSATVNVTINVN